MKQPENMCNIRNQVLRNVGKKVRIKANRGRNKIDIAEGIISETYPSVFLIELTTEVSEPSRTVSFSYTDVLTKEVELVLC